MKIWMQEDNEIPKEGSFAGDHEKLMEEAALACLEAEGIVPPEADHLAVSVSFVSEEEIRNINGHFRNVDEVTDVLSFPMMEGTDEILRTVKAQEEEGLLNENDGGIPLGDVVICTEKIRKQAAEYGHSETRELIYLFVHSMLHLLGYDHMEEEDRTCMRAREEEIMDKLGISR